MSERGGSDLANDSSLRSGFSSRPVLLRRPGADSRRLTPLIVVSMENCSDTEKKYSRGHRPIRELVDSTSSGSLLYQSLHYLICFHNIAEFSDVVT